MKRRAGRHAFARRPATERTDREETMLLRHLYNDQLAQASYLIGCGATGEALVVDPNRDIDQYLALAAREGLRIVAVAETHIHADFVSGARELAARTGARLYLSAAGPAEWQYAYAAEAGATLVRDGDRFMIGNVRIDVWHTPGHTPEHLSFLVTDTAGADAPMGIFTGDFVFVGDVGRPDLLERATGQANTMEAGARDLFRSLQRFRSLPAWVQVWPGHGAGSACGKALGAVPQSTVGYETRFNWAFAIADEQPFVAAVLAGQPEPPAYFARMKKINKEGPQPVGALGLPDAWQPERLLSERAAGTPIIDTRPADRFVARGGIAAGIYGSGGIAVARALSVRPAPRTRSAIGRNRHATQTLRPVPGAGQRHHHRHRSAPEARRARSAADRRARTRRVARGARRGGHPHPARRTRRPPR
jgi:hydroxyacylglutathione hydrolase